MPALARGDVPATREGGMCRLGGWTLGAGRDAPLHPKQIQGSGRAASSKVARARERVHPLAQMSLRKPFAVPWSAMLGRGRIPAAAAGWSFSKSNSPRPTPDSTERPRALLMRTTRRSAFSRTDGPWVRSAAASA